MTGEAVVFTTVGTDHHPFDRLVDWVEGWFATPRGRDARALWQTGTSRCPAGGDAYLTFDAMKAAFEAADAVVSHGGPATIMDARAAGTIPIVIPRQKRHGEHVDDHQVRFSGFMAARSQIVLVSTRDELWSALDAVLDDRGTYRIPVSASDVPEAVSRFADLVDDVANVSTSRRSQLRDRVLSRRNETVD